MMFTRRFTVSFTRILTCPSHYFVQCVYAGTRSSILSLSFMYVLLVACKYTCAIVFLTFNNNKLNFRKIHIYMEHEKL